MLDEALGDDLSHDPIRVVDHALAVLESAAMADGANSAVRAGDVRLRAERRAGQLLARDEGERRSRPRGPRPFPSLP